MLKATLAAIALATPVFAQDTPQLFFVDPARKGAELFQFAQDRLHLDPAVLDSRGALTRDRAAHGDAIVVDFAQTAPDPAQLNALLADVSGTADRVTYMMFADTAKALEPLQGVVAPANVKLVMAVRQHDVALVALAHQTAGTGYDGRAFSYRKTRALEQAAMQFRLSGAAEVKPWDTGAQYLFFDSELVDSGASPDAAARLMQHAQTTAGVASTWYDIEVGAFTTDFPEWADSDMHSVYRQVVGGTCAGYPWDMEVPPLLYSILEERAFDGVQGVWSQD